MIVVIMGLVHSARDWTNVRKSSNSLRSMPQKTIATNCASDVQPSRKSQPQTPCVLHTRQRFVYTLTEKKKKKDVSKVFINAVQFVLPPPQAECNCAVMQSSF